MGQTKETGTRTFTTLVPNPPLRKNLVRHPASFNQHHTDTLNVSRVLHANILGISKFVTVIMDAFTTCISHLRPDSLTKTGLVEFVVLISSATLLSSTVVAFSVLSAKDFVCCLSGDQFKNKDFIYT